ncbi:MAG: hypothetical protein PUP93_28060, partial [Rhizonema sp. NSF051]|nr:hypothetical protein [Rhizonema sp. NSF051]
LAKSVGRKIPSDELRAKLQPKVSNPRQTEARSLAQRVLSPQSFARSDPARSFCPEDFAHCVERADIFVVLHP